MKFYTLKSEKESEKKDVYTKVVYTYKMIEERELKEKYARSFYKDKPDDFINEVVSSVFWALLKEEECLGLFTVVEDNEDIARISHFTTYVDLLKTHTSLLVFFYIGIEKYYIERNYKSIVAEIPDIDVLRPIHRFFKKLKFSQINVYTGKDERYFYFMKSNLKEYYTEKDGELIPNIIYKNK